MRHQRLVHSPMAFQSMDHDVTLLEVYIISFQADGFRNAGCQSMLNLAYNVKPNWSNLLAMRNPFFVAIAGQTGGGATGF